MGNAGDGYATDYVVHALECVGVDDALDDGVQCDDTGDRGRNSTDLTLYICFLDKFCHFLVVPAPSWVVKIVSWVIGKEWRQTSPGFKDALLLRQEFR